MKFKQALKVLRVPQSVRLPHWPKSDYIDYPEEGSDRLQKYSLYRDGSHDCSPYSPTEEELSSDKWEVRPRFKLNELEIRPGSINREFLDKQRAALEAESAEMMGRLYGPHVR